MKDKKPIGIDARLAKHPLVDDAPAVWRHRMLRSKFWFAEIKGEVKSYRLACAGTARGATFKLVEEW